jgi:hypothetical protein
MVLEGGSVMHVCKCSVCGKTMNRMSQKKPATVIHKPATPIKWLQSYMELGKVKKAIEQMRTGIKLAIGDVLRGGEPVTIIDSVDRGTIVVRRQKGR